MPIVVPALMLVLIAMAVLVLTADVAWRHHVGVEVEERFRSYQGR